MENKLDEELRNNIYMLGTTVLHLTSKDRNFGNASVKKEELLNKVLDKLSKLIEQV